MFPLASVAFVGALGASPLAHRPLRRSRADRDPGRTAADAEWYPWFAGPRSRRRCAAQVGTCHWGQVVVLTRGTLDAPNR